MAFYLAYQDDQISHGLDPVITGLSQRVFPPMLRDAFLAESLDPRAIVLLWRLVRDTRLLLVENDLIIGINLRINEVFKIAEPNTQLPVTELKRVALASAFTFGTWSAVDAFNFRKNLCASQQEYEFLRAVRQFFPSLQAYPNQPLRNFIDVEKLEAPVPMRARNYAWSAQVDVLLCTADEDPVLGIELDSLHLDSEEAVERDELKNLLFKLAGLPLVLIRAADTRAVRSEDLYDLQMAESQTLDTLRPRRLRPRRTHDFLVPAEVATR